MNVIKGSSDSGKSSIVRALAWVFQNRPSGDEFVSWFAKEKEPTEVGVEFDDSWILKRRTGSTNSYQTSETEGTLEALRSDLPTEITSVTRIDDCNIQEQHETYFLLQDSPGEVARKLNQLTGLDIIDKMFKRFNSKITSLRTDILYAQNNVNTLKGKLAETEFIDTLDISISSLDRRLAEYEGNVKQVSLLTKAAQDLSAVEAQIEDNKAIIDVEPLLLPTLNKIARLNESTKERYELQRILADLEGAELQIISTKRLHDKYVQDYADKLTKAKICPTCGTPINDKLIKQIQERL